MDRQNWHLRKVIKETQLLIEMEVFKKIAEKGPITLYELSNKSNPKNPPYTSVTRILERWEELLWITVFDKKKLRNGNIRKTYIPTVTGVVHFFAPKYKVTNDLKSQFKKWGKEPKFYTGWEPFDIMGEYTNDPKKTIKNILLSTSFTDNAEKECDKSLSKEERIIVGPLLFQMRNKKLYDMQYNELYNDFTPFQAIMDNIHSNMVRAASLAKQAQLKRKKAKK